MKIKRFCVSIEVIGACEEVLKLASMDEHEKNKNLTRLNGRCKENQDLILVMHKEAFNETLLAIIEICSIFKV